MTEDIPDSLKDEATAWFVRQRDMAFGAEERDALAAWLAADPRHAAAFAAAELLWTQLDRVVLCSPPTDAVKPSGPRARVRQVRRRAMLGGALAAGIALLVAWSVDVSSLLADYRSPVGERRQVVLSDGSVAELNTGASLSVAYTAQRRLVRLHGGEAHFAVQPDAARPFVVAAAGGTATAIGTALNVKIRAARADVAVTQGIVDVRATGAGEAVRLRRGEMASFGPAGAGDVARVEPADVSAWQRDRLVFHNVPLGDVLDDLDRYRIGRIIVMDGDIARLPVTGVFDTRRTDAALDTMARTLPIRLVRVSDYLVLVYAQRPDDGAREKNRRAP